MADEHKPDTLRNRGDTDAPHMSPVLPSEDLRTVMINQISWGAVFAGAVLALITQLLLNLLGLGFGFSAVDPGQGGATAGELGIGAGIWFVLSGIIASFVGGIAAGRLSGKPRESTGGWHGLIAWAVATLGIAYLLTSAIGGVLGGALNTVGSVAQTAAQTAAQTGVAQDAINSAPAIANQITGSIDPNAAVQTANNAADAASLGSILAALGLLLGAVAAWFGGRKGAVDPTVTGSRGMITASSDVAGGRPAGTTGNVRVN